MRDRHRKNPNLLDRIRAGDQAARTELAVANLGLVFATADTIMAGSWTEGLARWQEREGLVERGYHGLCRACARAENVRTSVGGYLRAAIHNAMVSPDPGLITWLPKGQRVWPSLDAERIHLSQIRDPLRIFWEGEDVEDTLALIYWLCDDAADRRIIDGRVEGLSFAAVARRLGMHPTTVRRRLLRLEVEFWRVRKGRNVYQVRRRA